MSGWTDAGTFDSEADVSFFARHNGFDERDLLTRRNDAGQIELSIRASALGDQTEYDLRGRDRDGLSL